MQLVTSWLVCVSSSLLTHLTKSDEADAIKTHTEVC
jgi:hypothetical protein